MAGITRGERAYPSPPPSQTGRGNVQGSLSDQRRRVASTRRHTALLPLSASSRLVSRSFCLSLSLSDVMGAYKHDIWIFLCVLLF